MQDFAGKIAVITGAGAGIGRELARQLSAAGCHVAACDVLEDTLAETRRLCERDAAGSCAVSAHRCDVADEHAVLAFRDAVRAAHGTEHIHLLFNNAGVGGGSSFVDGDRREWERTFDICWFGVYYCARAFLPLLVASPEARMVNISSVNGFWATLGPGSAHSAYSAAKFAVKGFSEALLTDFASNAPHVKVSVVMPGHIGTSLVLNSQRILHGEGSGDLRASRRRFEALGLIGRDAGDDQVRQLIDAAGALFRDAAPVTAEQAAGAILDGIRAEQWRILVGDDAHVLDAMVRETPDDAYTGEFMERLRQKVRWHLG